MGKIHGSLARAGKVKSTTPKVITEGDSKTELQGRAKRRQAFNKRFNLVGRTGINSQIRQNEVREAKKTQVEVIASRKK